MCIRDRPIRTFAIGMSEDAIDLKYAKQVADYLHADHTAVSYTHLDVYKRQGYEQLHKMPVYETTHPPLGKDLIMVGIAMFGMTGFG